MIDPRDPMPGLDPYPRDVIDTIALHQERADLLEEIVSTPGPGKQPMPARTRVLLSIGIAAALAIIAGGGWFLLGGDDNGHDAAPVATAPQTTAPATPPTATPTKGDKVRPRGVGVGKVGTLAHCRAALSRRDQLVTTLRRLSHARGVWADGYLNLYSRDKDGHRLVAKVGPGCTIRELTEVVGHSGR